MKYCMTKNKDEIPYEIIRNDEQGLRVCAMCVHCVCIADIEQSCLFQYLKKREKSKFCIVDHREIGSIYATCLWLNFSAFAFVLYFILSSYKWLIMCIFYQKLETI